MTALVASLQESPDVAVFRLPGSIAALSQAVIELGPSAVAFDLGEMPGDLTVSLLRDRPGLIVVGADPSSDRMLVLSGRQEQPVSAAELLQVIMGGSASGSPSDVGSKDADQG
jgi:hypothetical protein